MRRRPVFLVLGLLAALALALGTLPMSGLAQSAKVDKLVFASAGFEDSNRFWMVARPDHLQYDPFLDTLLEVDPKTGEYTPRLAEKWSHSPDFREWTFHLRKGVQFHFGFGPMTARDVVHSHSFMLRPEATATLVQTLAQCRGGQGRQRPHGRVPHEAAVDHPAVCGVPCRRPPDRQQGPVGQGRAGGLRQAARRHRLLPVRQPAARALHHLRPRGQALGS